MLLNVPSTRTFRKVVSLFKHISKSCENRIVPTAMIDVSSLEFLQSVSTIPFIYSINLKMLSTLAVQKQKQSLNLIRCPDPQHFRLPCIFNTYVGCGIAAFHNCPW